MITQIIDFLQQAGALALDRQAGITLATSNKKSPHDGDVVTRTDLAISAMFKQFAARSFANLDYIIADEESISDLGADPFAALAAHRYQFIIDPIDGTLPYALTYPLYGISIGVFRDCRPYVGAVYLPALGQLLYNDEHRSYLIDHAFTERQHVTVLPPMANDTSAAAVIFDSPWYVNRTPAFDPYQDTLLNLYPSAVHAIYLASRRAKGFVFGARAWDLGGLWPVFSQLGIKLIGYHSGREVTAVSAEFFQPSLQVNELLIVSLPQYYSYIKDRFVPR
jgi:myo-inositol-1(or 4)-monophosphatase